MEINNETIGKLKSLSNEELSAMIKSIAQTCEADPKKTSQLISNIDSLRKSFDGITPQEAQKLLDKAGRDKSDAIYSELKSRGVI